MGSEQEMTHLEYVYTQKPQHMTVPASGDFILSDFDELLLRGWNDAMDAGHFRYTLTGTNQVRLLPGKFGFIIQLNELRGTERRKPDNIVSVNTEFDPNKFNFNKVKSHEILFYMKGEKVCDPVMINVSPLDTGHVLLVPSAGDCLPQRLNHKAATLGLQALLASQHRGLLVGFNSLCALASVNHLHLHAWYCSHPLTVHHTPVTRVLGRLHTTTQLPVPAFCLQLQGNTPQHLVNMLVSITQYLQETEVAHNVALVRGSVFNSEQEPVESENGNESTVRVYIWPRAAQTGVKNDLLVPFNIAVAELSGQIPFYINEEFATATEEDVLKRLHDTAALPQAQFDQISETLCQKFKELFIS